MQKLKEHQRAKRAKQNIGKKKMIKCYNFLRTINYLPQTYGSTMLLKNICKHNSIC